MIVNENDMNDTAGGGEGDDDVSGRAAARRAMRESKRHSLRPTTLRRKSATPVEGEAPPVRRGAPGVAARTPAERRIGKEARGDDYKGERGARSRLGRRIPSEPSPVNGSQREETAKPKTERVGSREPARAPDEYELHTQPDGTSHRVKVTGRGRGKPAPARRKEREDFHGAGPAIVDISKMMSWMRARRGGPNAQTGDPKAAAAALRRVFGVDPKVAVILGSGLFPASSVARGKTVTFAEIPGFSEPGVPGHPGALSFGDVNGIPTLFCEGRIHFYECGSMDATVHPVRTFIEMGVERLVITTSAGALNPEYKLGDIMFVRDHINMMGDNPLFGKDPLMDPSVFVDLSEVYSKSALEKAGSLLRRSRARGSVGVLAATRGPVYETVAERRLLREAGADAVCMSTIPEVIAAAHAGVAVTALAVIVNTAQDEQKRLTHDSVAKAGKRHSVSLKRLITNIIGEKW
jgi:purine-nucleoside phosphorylase